MQNLRYCRSGFEYDAARTPQERIIQRLGHWRNKSFNGNKDCCRADTIWYWDTRLSRGLKEDGEEAVKT